MSTVGCFGDCGFGGGGGGHSTEQSNKPKNISVVFHPPIQTILKEKDHAKWYTDMVNELATVGDDPNQFNEYGEAPLCVAADKGLGMVVAELLQRDNIKVNIKGKHGRTPLYIAAEGGHVFIVKCLLRHPSVDVNSRNAPGGATPLMIASRRGHSRIVELLLQHGDTDADLADRDGQTALHHARTNSVKWRLHNYSYRSRSVDNVMAQQRHNICHTSPSPPSSSKTNFRHFSLQEFHASQQPNQQQQQHQRLQGSSSDNSSRHSSSSREEREEDLEEEVVDEEAVNEDEIVFEDNQPLISTPEKIASDSPLHTKS